MLGKHSSSWQGMKGDEGWNQAGIEACFLIFMLALWAADGGCPLLLRGQLIARSLNECELQFAKKAYLHHYKEAREDAEEEVAESMSVRRCARVGESTQAQTEIW